MTDSDQRYIQKQANRYQEYIQGAKQESANDCLYRIASCLQTLPTPYYTPEIGEIALTWLRAHGWQV